MFKYKEKGIDEAELDVTAFMNLMIVLVPVLLLSMTFTQISVLEIKLPELTGGFGFLGLIIRLVIHLRQSWIGYEIKRVWKVFFGLWPKTDLIQGIKSIKWQ